MTVGELKEILKQYPDSTPIVSTGADCGGYDAIFTEDIEVKMFTDGAFAEHLGRLLIHGRDEE